MHSDAEPLPQTAEPEPHAIVPLNQEGTTFEWPPGTSELIARHLRPLSATAYRVVGDREVAADLAHEAIFRYLRQRGKYPEGTLYRPILQRILIDWVKKQAKHPQIELDTLQDLGRLASNVPDALAQAVVSDQYQRVLSALKRLPVEDAEMVLRHLMYGERTKTIAAEMGLSHEAVRTRIHRAVMKLRATLDRG